MTEDPKNLMVCVSTVNALCHFVGLGLEPGSFARALLKRDRNEAMRKAHPLLRRDGGVDSMLTFVDTYVPAALFTTDEQIDAWCAQGGFENATSVQKMMLHMMEPREWWRGKLTR